MDISDNNSCIFCKIGAGKDQNTQIVYQVSTHIIFLFCLQYCRSKFIHNKDDEDLH